MKAIILAAGEGTRISPFSETRPISMIGVAGQTLLDNTFSLLKSAGINDIFVVVGHKQEKLIERIQEQSNNGLNLHYVEQKRKLGIGHALMQVKNKISPGEYFLLLYGDTLTAENIFSKVQQSFHSFKCPVASICLPPSNQMFGNVFLNARMEITKIIEKPKGNSLGNYVLSGVFVLPESFFKLLESSGKSMEKALKKVVAGEGLRASMWEDEWLDVVYPWEILTGNKMIMDSWQESSIAKNAVLEANVTLQGVVRIEAGAIIKSGAVLEGPCCIGEGSYIGNNSLIRSYTSVGKNCSIGSGVELKNCVVMDNTQIGRLSFVGDSVLGENVDMGAGCMTVNRQVDWKPISVKNGKRNIETGMTKLGAFLGDGVVVGAGNTLPPGMVVAPGKILPACYTVNQK
ncbi:MAG: NTP transferase domain-containing protein [Nitrospina sp.]|jgi:UDP-N-acetylglucosamine diphosphorylase / glucose-1-phosphate thymidylyltransferase / UDP-N-acetylgalactosamine diphosphorylase / glucosamine-1-phosphate N-acetyltransferase / galactosamine-1-phosphate N-acetyltransferase|nr:NTP transferase domain-containing protein [Nitrospina sp.]